MMILCKTIHSLLGFSDPVPHRNIPRKFRNIPPPANGGLRCIIEEDRQPPDPPKSPDRGDPGAWGLHEAAGPAGGGLGICTESLGSESCDVSDLENTAGRSPRRRSRLKTERPPARKKFPPPLPWLSESSGRRSCFMKGERRDGRFLLKEVTIVRREVLRASRQNGRLRLHIVESESEKIREEEVQEDRGEVQQIPMLRCQEAVSGYGNMPMWWSHRSVTTA